MKKLLRGIIDFRKNVLPARRELFAKLAIGQAPDVLFITCSDSRVAPNWFASTDPGDLFVVRNVGNLVPPCDHQHTGADHSVAAAIEFSQFNLNVADIVVCGHSGCGAIQALTNGIEKLPSAHLRHWLGFAAPALKQDNSQLQGATEFSTEDLLSQRNVLQQIAHLKTYPKIRERYESGSLRLHAWWFDIAQAGVFAFEQKTDRFVLIDDQVAADLLHGREV